MGTELGDHRDDGQCVKALQSKDRSEISFVIVEAQPHRSTPNCQRNQEWKIVQVKRECYVIAHELAHLARRNSRTAAEQLQSDFVKYLRACM